MFENKNYIVYKVTSKKFSFTTNKGKLDMLNFSTIIITQFGCHCRCILVHGDYGGRECDGGEYQDEECDHDTTRCSTCFFNGVEYRNNDVIESTQCYQTLCVDNETRIELRCDQGPSSADHCGDDVRLTTHSLIIINLISFFR